ncbi:MAG: hypothetical protein CMK50_00095 [Propionibacteriaceae bacterium]|nr:hypothetical protein [Propionibacteriaceae bacterium]
MLLRLMLVAATGAAFAQCGTIVLLELTRPALNAVVRGVGRPPRGSELALAAWGAVRLARCVAKLACSTNLASRAVCTPHIGRESASSAEFTRRLPHLLLVHARGAIGADGLPGGGVLSSKAQTARGGVSDRAVLASGTVVTTPL